MRCGRCATEVTELVSFCPVCGAKLEAEREDHAGFGRRIGAFGIDLLLLPFAWFALFIATAFGMGIVAGVLDLPDSQTDPWVDALVDTWLLPAGFAVAQVAYSTFFEALPIHATPGKLAVGLAVSRADGQPLGLAAAFARAVVKLFLPGALAAFISPQRREVHDLVAGSVVVRRKRPAAAPAFVFDTPPSSDLEPTLQRRP